MPFLMVFMRKGGASEQLSRCVASTILTGTKRGLETGVKPGIQFLIMLPTVLAKTFEDGRA